MYEHEKIAGRCLMDYFFMGGAEVSAYLTQTWIRGGRPDATRRQRKERKIVERWIGAYDVLVKKLIEDSVQSGYAADSPYHRCMRGLGLMSRRVNPQGRLQCVGRIKWFRKTRRNNETRTR